MATLSELIAFVTAKEKPNDVDVVLVIDDGFRLEACPME